MGMRIKSCISRFLPFTAMVTVSCLDVGLTTLSKAAMSNGMNHFVFVAYSNSLATLLLFPFAFLFNRTKRPPLSLSIISKFFLLSLIGITVMQNCVFTGVGYSSPTLGTAMSNLIPAFTFILSVIFRMEKLDMRSLGSVVKILGTAISILGALIVTLYRGSSIGSFGADSPINDSVQGGGAGGSRDWVIGGLFLVVAGIAFSVWNISQAVILKGYPSEITIVFFYCLFGSIQSTIVALAFVRDLSAWKLKPDIELTAIVYSAIFGSMVTFYVQTWCIHKKGPVFVSMFTPLGIAIAVVMGVVFLGDKLYVGSILGAAVIVLGFYAVISTQSTEEKSSVLDSEKVPLVDEIAEVHVC
ncbi:hypothetical protein V2J09_006802 [Rumex salicifolius]